MHMALLDSTMSSMKSWYWLPISPWALHIVCTCTRAGHEAACNWPSHKLATDPPSWHRLLRCLVSFPGPFSRLERVVSCYQLNSWRKVGYLEAHKSFWHFRSFLGWSLMFTGDRKIRHSLFLSNKLHRGSCRGRRHSGNRRCSLLFQWWMSWVSLRMSLFSFRNDCANSAAALHGGWVVRAVELRH